MSFLPRVTELTREFVSRQFDDLGPDACMEEIVACLTRENPEFLEMARKCASDFRDASRIMVGFGMFYQLLTLQSADGNDHSVMHALPSVTAQTRDALVRDIDEEGVEAFTVRAIGDMERTNPELMQMAHAFASRHEDYLRLMQGFALLYKSLIVQAAADRKYLH
ncbi:MULTISPECIES: hypothetical protein [unclassified Rhizobium]|uniref:hypothetical protein n=1 Tax=unclassified Rhizobium TaxID=2613769 RepID=UPI00160CBC7C|nr:MULTISPECIES: hypothetical protein [unclassified Rhizobium]MBB3318130.1 hypothetical protein [Rhizobium sp. BK181]MBB3544759.1 hypothetical protein [Rhizobium sp. BK399]MCS3743340.1 hypothetical protein [Rhizobium sp. BK661]MCS4096490.1 hypothetical protein [Rhizobium sp. BK176]